MHSVSDPDSVPGVWRADRWASLLPAVVPCGHAELEPELPGYGWPVGQLTEVLQAQPGLHEWRLLLPALCMATARGALALVAPPHVPHLPALAVAGLPPQRVLRVEAQTPAERLWATEQLLQCRELGAVLAWLPQVRSEQLRRLQLACAGHAALAFVLRPEPARHESSPAPLRLVVRSEGEGLQVDLFKRRGPQREDPLLLRAPLPVQAALRRRKASGVSRAPQPVPAPTEVLHVVDRTAARSVHPYAGSDAVAA